MKNSEENLMDVWDNIKYTTFIIHMTQYIHIIGSQKF